MVRREDTGQPVGLAFDRETVRTLRDRIAERIRALIIDGGLTPGDRLVEPELARLLGVSRTPCLLYTSPSPRD